MPNKCHITSTQRVLLKPFLTSHHLFGRKTKFIEQSDPIKQTDVHNVTVKTKQRQNDKFCVVFFFSVFMGAPPFILEFWDIDSKVEARYWYQNASPEDACFHYSFGADLAQLCSEKEKAQWVNSQEAVRSLCYCLIRQGAFSIICVILSVYSRL